MIILRLLKGNTAMVDYYKQTILPPMEQVPAVNISSVYSDNCILLREDLFKELPFKDRIKQSTVPVQVHKPIGDAILHRSYGRDVDPWISTVALIQVGVGLSRRYTLGVVAYPVLFLNVKDVSKDDKLVYSRETESRRNIYLTTGELWRITEKVITCYFDKTRLPFLICPHSDDILLLEGILMGTTFENHPHDERLDIIISDLVKNCGNLINVITDDIATCNERVLASEFVPLLAGETVEALETTMYNVVNTNILKHYK